MRKYLNASRLAASSGGNAGEERVRTGKDTLKNCYLISLACAHLRPQTRSQNHKSNPKCLSSIVESNRLFLDWTRQYSRFILRPLALVITQQMLRPLACLLRFAVFACNENSYPTCRSTPYLHCFDTGYAGLVASFPVPLTRPVVDSHSPSNSRCYSTGDS